ncbi:hypothetical protein LMG24076_04398 [Trinickia soli]|nr:hypothetical protein LMG24076_04398 [Trinickia soli]
MKQGWRRWVQSLGQRFIDQKTYGADSPSHGWDNRRVVRQAARAQFSREAFAFSLTHS